MAIDRLEVSNLRLWDSRTGDVLVRDSSFRVKQGSCLAIVGESGSGKSLTCRAIMRLGKPGLRQSGHIALGGVRLSELPEREMRRRRGKQIALIMQNAMRAFDPSCVVGVQLRETLVEHFGWSRHEVTRQMTEAMHSVLLKDPAAILNCYPHQLSGGMLQRVMIALTLVLRPELVIADEPTTALDTLSQYEVVEQFIRLRAAIGCSMIFVSHDLGIVRRIADEMLVMRNGEIVESGPAGELFAKPGHEYTRYLVSVKQPLQRHFNRIMQEASDVNR